MPSSMPFRAAGCVAGFAGARINPALGISGSGQVHDALRGTRAPGLEMHDNRSARPDHLVECRNSHGHRTLLARHLAAELRPNRLLA